MAVKNGNSEIVKILLSSPKIDVNLKNILNHIFLNTVAFQTFPLCFKVKILITLQPKCFNDISNN